MTKNANIRSRGLWVIMASVLLVMVLYACATLSKEVYHGTLMKGSIVEKYDSEVYLCIGKKDGAVVGQEFDVYKVTEEKPATGKAGGRTTPTFSMEKTGKVKITEILDEHFAKSIVIEGTAEKNYIVKLETP